MDALCKCMFIIIETILNIELEDLTCFKGHRCFFKELLMSINRHMKKEIPGSHDFSVFALSNLLTNRFTFLQTGQLTSSEHAKCAFIIYYYICFLNRMLNRADAQREREVCVR